MSAANVVTARARLGECPVWDPGRQELAWVDVYNHWVHRFDPATGRDRTIDTGDVVSALALTADGQLLIALRDRLALLDVGSGDIETLCHLDFADGDIRFNDGRCDARGRFWIGTISKEPGQAALYRYDPDGSLQMMERGLTIANGIGWSPDGATFYLTDSPTRKIFAYRFDEVSGDISDRRVFIDFGDEEIEPDGLAIDREGHLWSALWDGWSVAHFDAEGRPVDRTPLPVQRPTSVAFGGPSLTDLYVTSASVGLSQQQIQAQHLAGDLFRIPADAAGLPTHRFGEGPP
jgi:sugar lactone lactonase YvrE